MTEKEIDPSLAPYRYQWPQDDSTLNRPPWSHDPVLGVHTRAMPESEQDLRADSRWPAFFPSPMCIVTTRHGDQIGMEKVVGASIVNRFPYVIGLSFCVRPLSDRHHPRLVFTDLLEQSGDVAVQFLPPGPALDAAMKAILTLPEEQTTERMAHSGLAHRRACTNPAPVFTDAYMVYEARLVKPGRDFDGNPIYETPWTDVGSHRIYYFEINAIQLREDIGRADAQVHWRSLPAWSPSRATGLLPPPTTGETHQPSYQKGFTPHYAFPSSSTMSFAADEFADGMAIRHLPALPQDQVEIDNDRARWPCFFPSSAGMITVADDQGRPNLAPCGSTTIISRHPLVIAPCISYAKINIRYAPRASLDMIRNAGVFGCGVPYIGDEILTAIKYSGNISLRDDPDKVRNSGMEARMENGIPRLTALPVHYDCKVIGEVRLGTHIMFLGEVTRIVMRDDVSGDNTLEWCPWAAVRSAKNG